jgi:glutamate dehydrogenase
MALVSESTHNLRRNLREIAEQQHLSARIGEYPRLLLRRCRIERRHGRSPEELLGAAVQHFRLGEARAPKQAAAALYTPDFDRHGWHSPHTVIDVVTDDMPFLVDSITMVVYRHGLVIHRLLHPLLGAERKRRWHAAATRPRGAAGSQPESWIHLEIDRVGDGGLIDSLHQEIAAVPRRRACGRRRWRRRCRAHARSAHRDAASTVAEADEAAAYLPGSRANNLVFLGYADYQAAAGDSKLARVAGSGLGILRNADHPRFGRCLAGIPGVVAELARDPCP